MVVRYEEEDDLSLLGFEQLEAGPLVVESLDEAGSISAVDVVATRTVAGL